jgi:hypothetical protein
MKRLVLALIILVGLASQVFAASSAIVTREHIGSDIEIVKIVWTTAANGSFTSVTFGVSGCLFYAITDPGTPAPTDNYDITVTNSEGIDIATSQLLDRDTANSEDVKFTTVKCVNGDLTYAISNNSVDSATGVTKLFFGR